METSPNNDYPNRQKIPGTQWYKNRPLPPTDWGPSLTSQEFKDDCNTEKILEKYSQAGLPPPSAAVQAIYADVSDTRNLHQRLDESRQLLQQAEEGFMQLDARTRKIFDNDVGIMAEWLADPENYEESVELGLRNPSRVQSPVGPASKAGAQEPLDVIVRTDTKEGARSSGDG